jgi:hypothetical protein
MRKTKAKAKVYCDNEDCKKTIVKVGETICWNCRRQAYRLSLRIKCSEYFDDKCEDCGLLRITIEDLNLFDFHHKIMVNKEFSISKAIIRNTWPEIEKELEKCTMLCKFCHVKKHVVVRNPYIKNLALFYVQEGE